jgi:protein-disulfide isomerase/uncharacterized membrane protein
MSKNLFSLLLILIYGLGIWLSDTLTQEHISFKLGDLSDHGICAVSQLFSCKAAAASMYSNIGGLPIAVIGEAYYLMALLLVICVIFCSASKREEFYRYLGATSIVGAVYSIFLGTVSALDLGFLCPLCMGLYAVNLLICFIFYKKSYIQRNDWLPMFKRSATWFAIILMLASLMGTQGVYAMRYQKAFDKAKRAMKKKAPPKFYNIKVNQSPIRGESTAVTLIEFADFQCPFCRKLSSQIKTVYQERSQEKYRNFRYVFKHYPLNSKCNPYHKNNLHPYACQLASAAVCAERQDKFWDMHDLLFTKQSQLRKEYQGIWSKITQWWDDLWGTPQKTIIDEQVLLSYAKDLQLDLSQFQSCLTAQETQDRILKDIEEAHKLKIPGTPSFYVNGWGFSGAVGTYRLRELIKSYGYGILPTDKESKKTKL